MLHRILLITTLLATLFPAIALAAAPVTTPVAAPGTNSAVLLMYHRFGEDKYPSTSIKLEQFEAHLDYLEKNNFTIWPLRKILNNITHGIALPDKTVAITIDDAYLSVYTEAYPRLKARDWPFTVFVTTDPVDKKLPAFMSWEQMREMQSFAHGATFANHGQFHNHLLDREEGEDDKAWATRILKEIDHAQQRLRRELDIEHRFFAYPYGEYDLKLAELVGNRGYIAFGQQSGPLGQYGDRTALPRFPINENYAELKSFATKIKSLPLPVISLKPWNPVVKIGDRPKLEIGLESGGKHLKQLNCFFNGTTDVKIDWISQLNTQPIFTVTPTKPLSKGRNRVNCTAPAGKGRFYWFSHMWLVR